MTVEMRKDVAVKEPLKHAIVLPDVHTVKVESIYRTSQAVNFLMWSPVYAVMELKPIAKGCGKCLEAMANFVYQPERAAAAKVAEKNEHSKAHERLSRSRMIRGWAVALATMGLAGYSIYLAITAQWSLLFLIFAAFVVGFDAVGHLISPREKAVPPPLATNINNPNVPLSQITRSILDTLEREGFEEGSYGVARPLRWDPERQEYSISLSLKDALTQDHVRAIERAVGAKNYSCRNLATDSATVRQLIIKVGDPLAGSVVVPWIDTRTLSARDPLPLGRSAGDEPMSIRFVGAHTAVVGRTRSGKTESIIWTIIDRLSACRDAIVVGIDLQRGPAFPMWREVIQKMAGRPDEALELLQWLRAEIDDRMEILNDLARSDDDDEAGSTWTPDLGHYIFCIIDEFALTATFNGKNDTVNLMAEIEEIIRIGLKAGVHLILASQKTGNSDFGSSVISSQVSIKILLACTERDTVTLLSTDHRDQGWAPHHLQPAQDTDPRDAGKCFIESPTHTKPDIYRGFYWPNGEAKRHARRRIADGLPSLDGIRPTSEAIDAVEVPQILASMEAAFIDNDRPEFMRTADLLEAAEFEIDGAELARQIKIYEIFPRKSSRQFDKAQPRGYYWADVQRAIRELG